MERMEKKRAGKEGGKARTEGKKCEREIWE